MVSLRANPSFYNWKYILSQRWFFIGALVLVNLQGSFAAGVSLEQALNGTSSASNNPTLWSVGNATAAMAHYAEGYSIPYRVVITNLTLGLHTMTIECDTTKNGKQALDYFTHFNRLRPHNQFGSSHTNAEIINPLAGLIGSFVSTNTFALSGPISGSFDSLPAGERQMTIYNGAINNISTFTILGGVDNPARITVTFTAGASNVVIAWGGHIASKQEWGIGQTAVVVVGSPYHMRLVDLDGSGGMQDRSLSSQAVVSPPFCGIAGPMQVPPSTTNNFLAVTDSGSAYAWTLTNIIGNAVVSGAATNSSLQVISSGSGAFQLGLTIGSGDRVSITSNRVVYVGLLLIDPRITGTNFGFSFFTQTGFQYRVFYTPTLFPTNWQLLSNLTGNGSTVRIQDGLSQTQRFYRVLAQ